MIPPRSVSFRSQLQGEISDFLEAGSMTCAETAGALVQLVVALSHYTEEGEDLHPTVVVFDDKLQSLRLLQGLEPIVIGAGPRSGDTVGQALKKCAPLARGGWALYVERISSGQFEYGVFREPTSPTALDLRDTIYDFDVGDAKIVLVHQLARRSVELVGPGGRSLQVHLSDARSDQASPFDALIRLAEAGVEALDGATSEAASSFLRTTVASALHGAHGALVAVVRAGQPIPNSLQQDGTALEPKRDLGELVKQHLTAPDASSLAALLAYGALLSGMLASDGITVISSDCQLLGYNVFVRSPDPPPDAPPSEFVGGARRRAFAALKGLVDSGELRAAYFRSSDGGAEYHPGAA